MGRTFPEPSGARLPRSLKIEAQQLRSARGAELAWRGGPSIQLGAMGAPPLASCLVHCCQVRDWELVAASVGRALAPKIKPPPNTPLNPDVPTRRRYEPW